MICSQEFFSHKKGKRVTQIKGPNMDTASLTLINEKFKVVYVSGSIIETQGDDI